MKIHNEEIKIYNNKINRNHIICVIGDIHNTKYSNIKTWRKIINEVKKQNPDFIIIPGDLIYSADDIEKEETKKKLEYLLKELSLIAPVYITYGNHDLKDGKKLKFNDTSDYFNSLENKYNIHMLNNKVIQLENMLLHGVCPVYTSYYLEYKDSWAENFINALLEKDIENKINTDRISILIVHSPEILIEMKRYLAEKMSAEYRNKDEIKRIKKTINILNTIDIFICAHMHNGLVPRRLEKLKIFKNEKGLLASESYNNTSKDGSILKHKARLRIAEYCRGIHDIFNGKMIISRGITKWCQPNFVFGIVDYICSKDITTVNIFKK